MTDDRGPCITLPLEMVEMLLECAAVLKASDMLLFDEQTMVAAIQAEVDQVKGLAQEHLKC